MCLRVSSTGRHDANLPHYHRGVLPRYEIGPPTIKLTASDEETLRSGGTIQQAILIDLVSGEAAGSADEGDHSAKGPQARRLLMVKDVAAPQSIIADRLLDYASYPRMVKGCDKLEQYDKYDTARPGRKPLQVMKAKYNIHALHMRFTYFMVHEWDPVRRTSTAAHAMCFPPFLTLMRHRMRHRTPTLSTDRCTCMCARAWLVLPPARPSLPAPDRQEERCMVFYLDYSKRSDMDDSVGYWYLQPTGPERCRVYYSCVTRLRTWVPKPVYALLTKTALKQATVWIDHESVQEWEQEKARRIEASKARKLAGGLQGLRERAREQLEKLAPNMPQPAFIGGRLPPSAAADKAPHIGGWASAMRPQNAVGSYRRMGERCGTHLASMRQRLALVRAARSID